MSLKKAYLYLVSVISLIIAVIGAIMIINLGLKTWVFTKADRFDYSGPCYSQKPVAPNSQAMPCTPEEEAEAAKRNEDNRTAQKQDQAAQAIAMLIIAAPVWWFHWKLAKKEV